MPPGHVPPQASDCYRFSLSNPHVHVATCGPRNDAEMETALNILETGPMDRAELERMRAIGDAVHETKSLFSMMNG